MKFLIPTEPDDSHAILAKIGLEHSGHEVRLVFIADQPTLLKNSILIDNDTYQWRSSDKYDSIVAHDYDVVWWRRARKPYLPKALTHPADYQFIMRENRDFYESLTNTMAPNAWWVNNKDAAHRGNTKLLQLKVAADCGMTIPNTLCSNDPQDIRYFLLKHESDGVVYKPLCSNYWVEEKRMRIVYTSRVSFQDLPSNTSLQLSPGIFQKEIKKKYELRVTCFGDYIVAAKLNSQEHVDGQVDWRAISTGKMSVDRYVLPYSLENQLKLFMRKMGLVFGTFDFIVSEEHDYVFLEVNEQGQFLWIEEYNSDMNMLDIFVNFLQGKSRKFKWDSTKVQHTVERYRHQMSEMLELNMQRHVDLNHIKTHKESE